MIKKFKKIDNFAVFNDFEWDKNVIDNNGKSIEFKPINIIYGRNYSGKTSLSRLVRSLETGTLPENYKNPVFTITLENGTQVTQETIESSTLDVRVFNQDFVRSYLEFLIHPEGEITSFAVIGKNNVSTEKKIRVLEKEIGENIKGQETGLYKLVSDAEMAENKAKKLHEDKKFLLEGKLTYKAIGDRDNRKDSIKYNSEFYGDQNYTTKKIERDIGTVINSKYRKLSKEDIVQNERIVREEAKGEVSKLVLPNLRLDFFSQKTDELLSRSVASAKKIAELLSDTILNQWVKTGVEILGGKDKCAFCENVIDSKRWEELHNHFDDESKKIEREITELQSEINSEMNNLKLPFHINKSSFYVKYHTEVDKFMETREKLLGNYLKSLDNLVKQLDNKRNQLTVAIPLHKPLDNREDFLNLFSDFNAMIEANNNYTKGLQDAKSVSQEKLRLHEVADFCKTIDYITEKSEIAKLYIAERRAGDDAKAKKELLRKKINELYEKRGELNDETEGAELVNQYLINHFGHNFLTLEAQEMMQNNTMALEGLGKETEEKKLYRFCIMRDGKPAFNLSEGECSLISFCYFIAKLNDVETVGTKPVIWIDDPISSLDSNHIFFIYSLIVSQIARGEKFSQLFISTHNLDFLKYLNRLNSFRILPEKSKAQAVEKMYLFIERVGKCSSIKIMPNYLRAKATEFNYLFSIIYKCSKCEAITDDNYDMLCGFGNNTRKFLELFLFFKYPDSTEDLLPKLRQFWGSEDIPPILMDRMFNEESHGSSPENALRNDVCPETIPVAKKLIEKLSEDKEQYNALLKSIGEGPIP